MSIDVSAVARVVGIDTVFKDLRGDNIAFLPQRIAVVGQGSTASTYPTTKAQVTDAATVGSTYGFGSPLHRVCQTLLPRVGTIPVTVYPLEDDASGVAAAGDITPAGAATEAGAYRVVINNVESDEFVINVGDTVATIVTAMTAAINANLDMPVVAGDNTTDVTLTAKWEGVSGNAIVASVEGPSVGVTFAITQPTGGLVNPSVAPALAQIGNVWETLVINCLDADDTTALDAFQAEGETRWGQLVRKPFVAFYGNTATTVSAATSVTSTRTDDRVNSQLVAPGSTDLPFVVAAAQVAEIARIANNNPPQMYTSQVARDLTPGADGDQWDFVERDQAIKAGSSTVEVIDGNVNISNVVTPFAPVGQTQPAYRFVVDIIKVMNTIFNIDLVFASAEWAGAPLIPDNQPTTNLTAKKPKLAVAAVHRIIDALALEAILSDPETAKANTFAQIDTQNPKRLNVQTAVQISGNTNIIDVTLNFGFFFGTATVVA